MSSEEATPVSKRPKDTPFRQQRLPAWHPLITPCTVITIFFVFGVVILPLGIGFLVTSNGIQEYTYDYTNCTANSGGGSCAQQLAAGTQGCTCNVSINVQKDMSGPVFMYYQLTNFYQNHRRYVKSRDDAQLHGDTVAGSSLCSPLQSSGSLPINPCGLVANSLFNDSLVVTGPGSSGAVFQQSTGIAWKSDEDKKFNNPGSNANLTLSFAGTAAPPNWPFPVSQLGQPGNIHPNGNGLKNEDFIVWMRVAALPNFRKLYRIQNADLPAGVYTVTIAYNYPSANFDGTKTVVFAQSSWMGGKNNFLGICYIVVGVICLVLGVVFTVMQAVRPRIVGDVRLINWSRS